MAHAAGFTLITLRAKFTNTTTHDKIMNVFHYFHASAASTTAIADSAALAFKNQYVSYIDSRLHNSYSFVGTECMVDDGTTQSIASRTASITGTVSGTAAPQVICAIVRKRALGRGRRRFGHVCQPGLATSFLADPNTITTTFQSSLQTMYDAFLDGTTTTGLSGAYLCLYDTVHDTTGRVESLQVDTAIRTNRRRTPGRGA